MGEYLNRKIHRVGFYLRGILRDRLPRSLQRKRLEQVRRLLSDQPLDEDARFRINYYNRLSAPFPVPDRARAIEEISLDEGSYYYFDMKEYLLPFDPGLRVAYTFGDNIEIPAAPEIVKSRPIAPGNHNAVVLKLDKLRHYTLFASRDRRPFRDKRAGAVWRGTLNNPMRVALVERFGRDGRHDVGYTGAPRLECSTGPSGPLTVEQQLGHRYVLSIEGYDVATNLKWIFASRSLCLMPKPKFETWFMEGTLEAGTHYVEVRPDFEDLDDRVDYFERHPDEAEAIIDEANRFYRQFLDPGREYLLALMVVEKYFELSGQLPRQPFSNRLFGEKI